MFNKVNFSMADRINSLKAETSNRNDVSAVPTRVNAKPGDSNLNLDTSAIDNAGSDVGAKQAEANTATSPEQSNTIAQKATGLEYTKPDSPEYPTETDPGKVTPTPKKKGFTERLLDAQMASMLSDNTGRPANNNQTAEYPKEQSKDLNKPQPQDNTPNRPNTQGFNPASIGTIDPQQPSGDVLGNIPGAAPGATPGPLYSAPGAYKGPAAFKSPRLNFPKLNR